MSDKKFKLPIPPGFPRLDTDAKRDALPRNRTGPQTIEIESEWIIDEEEIDDHDDENED